MFATGTDGLPVPLGAGYITVQFVKRPATGAVPLPVAHTCAKTIDLCSYESAQTLFENLRKAIIVTGFGFV